MILEFTKRGRKQRPLKRQKIIRKSSIFDEKWLPGGYRGHVGGTWGTKWISSASQDLIFMILRSFLDSRWGQEIEKKSLCCTLNFNTFCGRAFCGPGSLFLEVFWSPLWRLFSSKSENGELCLDCTGVSGSHVWLPQKVIILIYFTTLFMTWFRDQFFIDFWRFWVPFGGVFYHFSRLCWTCVFQLFLRHHKKR